MNMRTIKFRCWVSSTKNMIGWDELEEHGDIYRLIKQPNAYPLMQFTGLKDKNGVDIYEGDILAYSLKEHFGGLVEFYDGSFFVKHSSGSDSCIDNDFEVIGNIHEHKHLLENNNEDT